MTIFESEHWDKNSVFDLVDWLDDVSGKSFNVEALSANALDKNHRESAQLAESVCAFANSPEGGLVVLGLEKAPMGRDEESESFAASFPAENLADLVSEAEADKQVEPAEKPDAAEDFAFSNYGWEYEIAGVQGAEQAKEDITEFLREAIAPAPRLTVDAVDMGKDTVVLVRVAGEFGGEDPARYRGSVFARTLEGNVRLSEREAVSLSRSQSEQLNCPADPSAQPVAGTSSADFDPALAAGYLAQARAAGRRLALLPECDVLALTGATIGAQGQASLAALYCLGYYPQGRFPALFVTLTQERSGSGRRIANETTLAGPLPDLLEDAMEWCHAHISRSVRGPRARGRRSSLPDVPLPALRAFITAALLNRDLSPATLAGGDQVRIHVSDEAVEIHTPGGLSAAPLSALLRGGRAARPVNQLLSVMAKQVPAQEGSSVIEPEGVDLPGAIGAIRGADLPDPEFINTGSEFIVVIHRLPQDEPLPDRASAEPAAAEAPRPAPGPKLPPVNKGDLSRNEPAVTAALLGGPLSIAELTEATGLNTNKVRYAINNAIDGGRIEMIGARGQRNTRYRLVVNSE